MTRLTGFVGSTAALIAYTDSSVILADLNGVDIEANGFLGTVRLTTVSDFTRVPVRVELLEVVLTDAMTALTNVRTAGGIGVTANPLASVLSDLNGDGLVDEGDVSLFSERFVLGVGRQDAQFGETIDFDPDEQLTKEDVYSPT